MRPTPEETLTGADRLLRGLLDEPDLPPVAGEIVTDVRRLLEQARRVVADVPAFLAEDNERLRDLLAELIRALPPVEHGEAGLDVRDRIHAYLAERTTLDPR